MEWSEPAVGVVKQGFVDISSHPRVDIPLDGSEDHWRKVLALNRETFGTGVT